MLLIDTETFRLVREMGEILWNMAWESAHRDIGLGCDVYARYSVWSMIVLLEVHLVIDE